MTTASIVTIVLVSAIAFAILIVALVERHSEDATVRRLLRQRDQARARIDAHNEDDEP